MPPSKLRLVKLHFAAENETRCEFAVAQKGLFLEPESKCHFCPAVLISGNGCTTSCTDHFSTHRFPMSQGNPTGEFLARLDSNCTCAFGQRGTTLSASARGVISGTPTSAGTFNGVITASNGTLPNATQSFSIVVITTTVAPTTTSSVPSGSAAVGQSYSHTASAIGTSPKTFLWTAQADPAEREATALLREPTRINPQDRLVRAKAVSRCACHRSPKSPLVHHDRKWLARMRRSQNS